MAKWQNDLMLDAALDFISNNTGYIYLCSAQPTSYDEAAHSSAHSTDPGYMLAYALIGVIPAPVDASSSGRRIVIPEHADITVSNGGTATHIALVDVTLDRLLYVTTCNSQAVTGGNLVTIPSWEIEMRDAM